MHIHAVFDPLEINYHVISNYSNFDHELLRTIESEPKPKFEQIINHDHIQLHELDQNQDSRVM